MDRIELGAAIRKTGIAYIFAFLDFNLTIGMFTLNFIPDWMCFVILLSVLPVIGSEEPEALLLKPLCKLMVGIDVFLWITILSAPVLINIPKPVIIGMMIAEFIAVIAINVILVRLSDEIKI